VFALPYLFTQIVDKALREHREKRQKHFANQFCEIGLFSRGRSSPMVKMPCGERLGTVNVPSKTIGILESCES
jgi:hypothetical protein